MPETKPLAEVELHIPSRPEYVGVARLAILGVASRMRFSYDEVEDIRLAVGEACTRSMDRLEGADADRPIRLRCLIDANRLTIEVRNPLAKPVRPAGPVPAGLPESGDLSGVLIRILMDEVYTEERQDEGVHIVRMVKYVSKVSEVESRKPHGDPDTPETDPDRLFRDLRRTGDPTLREQLVARHENLVRFLAAKFANRGEPLDDLIQVGTIGLINAVDRFEPERGIKFSTYATPTIVGEIKRYFRDRAWNLKVPRWLQELNARVMKANDLLAQELGRSPSILEVANYVDCSEEDALHAMELGNAYETVSLDTQLAVEGEAPLTLSDSIGAADLDLHEIHNHDDLKTAVEQLDNREKMIIYLRFYQELSQTEVARRLNISQMHVSRLQHRALQRLRALLLAERKLTREAA